MSTSAHGAKAIAVERVDLFALVSEAVNAGGHAWVHVRGASMLPAIPRGADVRIIALRSGSVRRGDVVFARAALGDPVVHRVWLKLGRRVWLKGDFRVTPDSPISPEDIVGVVAHVRHGARLLAVPGHASRTPSDVARRWRAFARDWLAGA